MLAYIASYVTIRYIQNCYYNKKLLLQDSFHLRYNNRRPLTEGHKFLSEKRYLFRIYTTNYNYKL